MVQEEQRASDFTISYGGGGEVALKDLKDKRSYHPFIPGTTTPSCTAEAKNFAGH